MKKIHTIVIVFCSVLAWGFASGQTSVPVSANQKANAEIKRTPLQPLDKTAEQENVQKEEKELDANVTRKNPNTSGISLEKKKAAYIPPKRVVNAEKPKK